ncbi:MAG: U32 family peptidase [Methanomicrobiales archaeon]
MKVPELLAPAGSPESLVAAIDAGADAVYLGGNRFSARNYAENFNPATIADAVRYAHLRGVKVYVTVNTLVHDSELTDTAAFILSLYQAGIDAILVQDTGVASVAREVAPGLPLHASTQMTIHNREGVSWAREQGFSRVVLARELSLEEISEIASAPECQGVGLEIFVHGALCYSYSGQCLLSSMIGGRSGNRGMCAQPCRKPYACVSGPKDLYGRPGNLSKTRWEEEYLMSTKDLCSYRDLESIVRAPVESLKIEGRMRSPRYVSTVVSVYRKAIDAIAMEDWSPRDDDVEKLALAFNRGFTRGYLKNACHREIMGRDRPDHRGIPVGTVISYNSRVHQALIRLSGATLPFKGDGVVFQDPRNGKETGMILYGTPVKDADTLQVPVSTAVIPGDILYLTRRRDPGTAGKKYKTEYQGKQFQVPIDLIITWDEERRPVINALMSGKNGIPVRYSHIGEPMQIAETAPLTISQIAQQVRRTGGTPFVVRELVLDYPGGLYAPVSILNQLRRDLLLGAESAIASSWMPGPTDISCAMEKVESLIMSLSVRTTSSQGLSSGPMKMSVYANSAEVATAALDAGCDRIYFEPETGSKACRCRDMDIGSPGQDPFPEISGQIRDLLVLLTESSRQIFWKWPSIPERDYIDASVTVLPELVEMGIGGIMVDSAGLAKAVRRLFPALKICGGAGLNIFNHVSAASVPGFFSLTLSPELSSDDISALTTWHYHGGTPAFEVIVQGNLEVLNSRDCIPAGMPHGKGDCGGLDESRFSGLQDGTGRTFPFNVDPWCHTHIRNSSETCLIDSIPGLIDAGVSSVAIDARHKTPAYVKEMVSLYREAIRRSLKSSSQEQFTDLLTAVKKISLGGITSASFRGNLL